jgi:hypothetical protein
MPNWDVSLVTDMSGWTGTARSKALAVKVHSTADISKWDTAQVTHMMDRMFASKLLRSTKTLGVGTQHK